MKILTIANEKGGVGKSAITTNIAFYAGLKLNKKILVIDLDQQGNSSKALTTSNFSEKLEITSSDLFFETVPLIESKKNLVAICADRKLLQLESLQKDKQQQSINKFNDFLKKYNNQFDYCIIDTNPSPDIRLKIALSIANFVLSPIQLNQEAIDGIGALFKLIQVIRKQINPKLSFLGILPNLVEHTPFQRDNLTQIVKAYSKIMIPLGKTVAFIPKRTAIAEAQAEAIPLWLGKKSTAKTTWAELQPIFDKIISLMEEK